MAAEIFAIDPDHLCGIWLHAKPGPVRDVWHDLFRELFPPGIPFGKLPLNATDEALFGGIDLPASLASGKLIRRLGLLGRVADGILLLPDAGLLSVNLAAQLARLLDGSDPVAAWRDDACYARSAPRIIVFDETGPDELSHAAALQDRIALQIRLENTGFRDAIADVKSREEIQAARAFLAKVQISDAVLSAICAASVKLGIASLRAPVFAVAAARASAALGGRTYVTAGDAAIAARLVLSPRAMIFPQVSGRESGIPSSGGQRPEGGGTDTNGGAGAAEMTDLILAAARAVLPRALLSRVPRQARRFPCRGQSGRSGTERPSGERGRPAGVRRPRGKAGERISASDTIRAAVPWQRIRREQRGNNACKLFICRDDLRVRRFISFARSTTIFAVDASGSAAMQRLSEAKGAVELLLAQCYVRRDQVALIVFRGKTAAILLPPTRSLTRAKRALRALAGGGATPLASGIATATALASRTRRNGGCPLVVLLTDGQANIGVNGEAGRETAHGDAMKLARLLGESEIASILIDISPRPQRKASELAQAMRAVYLPLPNADARTISAAARSMAAA